MKKTVIIDEQNNKFLKRANHKHKNYLQVIRANLNCQRISDLINNT